MTLRTLIAEAGEGDAAAFKELVQRHQNMVFGYAFSLLGDFHLAEDATQETFIAAYFNLAKLRDADVFPAWLRGIARHQCGRIMRQTDNATLPLDTAIEIVAATDGPEVHLEREETRQQVLAAIKALPPAQREVTILYYLQEHSHKEIAAFLGVPVTTINNRLYAARQRLHRRMITMVQETLREHALLADFAEKVGQVIKVRGSLVEARFSDAEQPQNFDVLTIADAAAGALPIRVQVAQRLDGGVVRGIATSDQYSEAYDELQPGARLSNAGLNSESLQNMAHEDIVRAVKLVGNTRSEPIELLETGIKIIDLFCPIPQGGNIGLFGVGGNGATVLLAELFQRLAETPEGLSIFYFVRRLDAAGLQGLATKEPFHPGDKVGTVQNFWLQTDFANDPDYAAGAAFLDATLFFSPMVFMQGMYPALDPLVCASQYLDPAVVGEEHYATAQRARQSLQRAKELMADTVFLEYVAHRAYKKAQQRFEEFLAARLGELPEEDRLVVSRARQLQRFFTQPFFVAEAYTGLSGKWVNRHETLRSCNAILDGQYDDLPEHAFSMIGSVDEVKEK